MFSEINGTVFYRMRNGESNKYYGEWIELEQFVEVEEVTRKNILIWEEMFCFWMKRKVTAEMTESVLRVVKCKIFAV